MRRAHVGDAPGIAAVDALSDPHPWTEAAVRATLILSTTQAWVVQRDTIVAHILVSAGGGQGELLRLAVHPAHRRQGIARRLMQAAEHVWRAMGVGEAFLEVRDDNAVARALYGALGWTELGRRVGYYGDGVDAVTFRLTIRA